jgi:hypothetical protein
MRDQYLLYIDILGFEHLVETAPQKVDELYEIVESLNVHAHGSFAAITFSDTILVHNVSVPVKDQDHRYVVMYQCEFARDLMHRIAGRAIVFRAVLLYGAFQHYRLNSRPYYYGPALNLAYHTAENLQLTGLVMDDHCRGFSSIFKCRSLKGSWHYVFLTQALEEFENTYGAKIPLSRTVAVDTDLGWFLGPELEVLRFSALMAREHPDPRVRQKHQATLAQYKAQYPECFRALEGEDFRMEVVSSEFDWSKVRARMQDGYDWASVRRPPLRGGQPPEVKDSI